MTFRFVNKRFEVRVIFLSVSFIYSVQATSGKKLHQGKEYDYVFDIEIDEPRCTLKLPFNIADDPYMAAQQFIHK